MYDNSGGIFKVVFNQSVSMEAIRLYRRTNCCWDRYNKLSVTVRVSAKSAKCRSRPSSDQILKKSDEILPDEKLFWRNTMHSFSHFRITYNACFKGPDYTWRKCTTSDEGDPFKAPDSKSQLALRFPLENAVSVTEVQFDFNQATRAQIAELEFDFSSWQ